LNTQYTEKGSNEESSTSEELFLRVLRVSISFLLLLLHLDLLYFRVLRVSIFIDQRGGTERAVGTLIPARPSPPFVRIPMA